MDSIVLQFTRCAISVQWAAAAIQHPQNTYTTTTSPIPLATQQPHLPPPSTTTNTQSITTATNTTQQQ